MRRAALTAVLGVVLALAGVGMARATPVDPCVRAVAGEQCGPGNGRQTPGGGDKVSHDGWPAVTGVLWKVLDVGNHGLLGGPANDELLGHHGSDTIIGGRGHDIIWGDWDPVGNTGAQRDVLRGGAGGDFIYSSHGTNRINAGAGNDTVWAFYGRGTIDCGPGNDVLRVRLVNDYRIRNCETLRPFCAHGYKPGGGCFKPGEPGAKD